jgi:hypothetical protein
MRIAFFCPHSDSLAATGEPDVGGQCVYAVPPTPPTRMLSPPGFSTCCSPPARTAAA